MSKPPELKPDKYKSYILTDEERDLLEQLCKTIMPPGSELWQPTAAHVPAFQEGSKGIARRLFYIEIKDPIIKELARRAIAAGIGGEYIKRRSVNLRLDSDGGEEITFIPQDGAVSYPAFYEMIIWYKTFKAKKTEKGKPAEESIFKRLGYKNSEIIDGLWQYLNGNDEFFKKCIKFWGWPHYFEISPIDQETFALPALPIMFTFLPMFAGKSENIPRAIFTKEYSEFTENEKEKADLVLDSLLGETKKEIDENGKTIETRHYIVSDNLKVKATGCFDLGLFQNDLAEQEKSLSLYIKKAYGPEGMRHFLALIIGLEENFRQGFFYWNLNDHLKRLGIKKKKSGVYDKKARIIATNIIKLFISFCLTAYEKKNNREIISALKFFSIDGYRAELFNKKIIDSSLLIRAADFWYKNAFIRTVKDSPKYTKLLKNIVKVNHREHPLVLYLAPLFAIFWRINPERKLSVISLMNQCDLDFKGPKRTDDLKKVEGQLDWMKKHGHLGDWHNNGENKYPSKCKDPFKCMLSFDPPNWFNEEMKSIRTGRDSFKALPPPQAQEIITIETIETIKQKTRTSNKTLANHLGVTPQYIGLVLSKKRPITTKLSKAIQEYIKDQEGG